MNIPGELMGYASQYMTIVGAASFLHAIIAIMSAIARSNGFTRFPMVVAIIMNICNITGSYIVVFRPFGIPSPGVAGIAVASVVSEALGAVLIILLLARNNIKISIREIFPFPRDIAGKIVRVGTPAAAEHVSYIFTQIASVYFISLMGADSVNANVYTKNITALISIVSISIGQGSQLYIGYQIGAKKFEEAYKTGIASARTGVLFNCVISLVFILLRWLILGFFTNDPEIIRLAEV